MHDTAVKPVGVASHWVPTVEFEAPSTPSTFSLIIGQPHDGPFHKSVSLPATAPRGVWGRQARLSLDVYHTSRKGAALNG